MSKAPRPPIKVATQLLYHTNTKLLTWQLGVGAHVCKHSTEEDNVGGLPGCPDIHGRTVRTCLKNSEPHKEITLCCLSELDSKSLLPKTLSTLGVENRGIILELSWSLLPCCIVLPS